MCRQVVEVKKQLKAKAGSDFDKRNLGVTKSICDVKMYFFFFLGFQMKMIKKRKAGWCLTRTERWVANIRFILNTTVYSDIQPVTKK